MIFLIQHKYNGAVYNSAYEANKAAVQDMMVDVDIDYLDDFEALAEELIAQGFTLPAFNTDVEHLELIIGDIVEDYYHQ